ncbi:hypothetical protein C1890_02890 [Pseudomonas sp. DP16D-R1]|nr:hypothetical protein C1890_02890 [Pseudomonas sp. DP16D-R1]
MWERACSRFRSIIQHLSRLIRPDREQARSHSFCVWLTRRAGSSRLHWSPATANPQGAQRTGHW